MKKHVLTVTTPSDTEIAMTRSFDAPRALVFDAWTKPALLQRWLGVLPGWTWAECTVDLRVGGGYRFLWRGPAGETMGMRGTYLEVGGPDRLVSTEVFDEAWYEGSGVNTLVLTERDGVTTCVATARYGSKEIRDAVLRSPMEQGVAAGYDNLDAVFAAL
ncbi:MAG: SRPBCC family protein [Myxococcota bacterium]